MNKHASGAITRQNDLPAFATFESGLEAVEAKFPLLLFSTVAFGAGFLENGLNILVVSHTFDIRSGWELAGVYFLISARRDKGNKQGAQTEDQEVFHKLQFR